MKIHRQGIDTKPDGKLRTHITTERMGAEEAIPDCDPVCKLWCSIDPVASHLCFSRAQLHQLYLSHQGRVHFLLFDKNLAVLRRWQIQTASRPRPPLRAKLLCVCLWAALDPASVLAKNAPLSVSPAARSKQGEGSRGRWRGRKRRSMLCA